MAHYPMHKVLWSEGMLVGPHHFQQGDRYHEAVLDFRLRPLVPFGWGITELSIDHELLETSGIFMLESLRGVFASGTTINIPRWDDAPASREVMGQHFVAPANRLDVYLGLPVEQPNAANIHQPGRNGTARNGTSRNGTSHDARYVPDFVRVVDESSGANEQEIVTAKKNVCLLFGSEPSANLERFKIAELIKHGDGRITLDEEYIPVSLFLTASPRLQKLLQSLLAELTTKRKILVDSLPRRTPERVELNKVEPETLWALNLLNMATPILNHFCQVQRIHPETVYRTLLQLAGQLSMLTVNIEAIDTARYEHDALATTFGQLDQTIRRLLNLVATPYPSAYTVFELEETTTDRGYAIWRTKYTIDQRLFTPAHRFYLAIRAQAVETKRQRDLIDIMPETLTVAAHSAIDEYIEFAYGVRLRPTTVPADAPSRPGVAYFMLENSGPPWESVQATQALAIYLPPEFRNEFKEFVVELVVEKIETEKIEVAREEPLE